MRWLMAAALATAIIPQNAFAKSLSTHLGIGFTSAPNGPTALTARFFLPNGSPTSNIAIEARGGFSSDEDSATTDQLLFGVRGLYGFVAEDHLNVYASAAVEMIMESDATTPRVSPGISIEYFPFGMEFLGFSAEFGVAMEMNENRLLQTYGNPAAGLSYYF